jgi:hypothetical protein
MTRAQACPRRHFNVSPSHGFPSVVFPLPVEKGPFADEYYP